MKIDVSLRNKALVVIMIVLLPFIVLTVAYNSQNLFGGENVEGVLNGFQVMYNFLLLIIGIASPILLGIWANDNWDNL